MMVVMDCLMLVVKEKVEIVKVMAVIDQEVID